MAITPTFTVVNAANISQAIVDQLIGLVTVALGQWSAVLAGSASLTVRLELLETTPSGRTFGGVGSVFAVGAPNNGRAWEGAPGYQLRTGVDPNGAQADIVIGIARDYLFTELFLDPTPDTANDIPPNRTDALSVFVHEIGHALGMIGYYDEATNSFIQNLRSPYDWRLQTASGNVVFSGPNVQAVLGGPVPLTDNNYTHYGNVSQLPGADLLAGLMNGVTFFRGVRYTISDLDLAFMADLGLGTVRNDVFDQTWLDVINGGPGIDVFRGSYAGAPGPVSLDGSGAALLAPGLRLIDVERFDVVLSPFDDSFVGAAIGDRVAGGAGNDMIAGGAGVDTAVYGASSTSAAFSRAPSGAWTVTTGLDGVDVLTGVELLQFSNRTLALRPAEGTIDGDGASDILLRNVSGAVALWSLSGAVVTNAQIIAASDPRYAAVGQGDFDGDGKFDVLFRAPGGAMVQWRLDGGSVSSAATYVTDPAWTIVGIGDFNGDVRDDILYRNAAGLLAQWQMNGLAVDSIGIFATSDTRWSLAQVADFNGDGKDDLLWRNATGVLALWQMDGFVVSSAGVFATSDPTWQIVGAGDFNGDLREDILWRSSTGALAQWQMDGAAVTSVATFAVSDPAWSVSDIGDYNGDGRDDILWQGPDGTFAIWMLDGFAIASVGIVGAPGLGWTDIV